MAFVKFKSYDTASNGELSLGKPLYININTDQIQYIEPRKMKVNNKKYEMIFVSILTNNRVFYCLPEDEENKHLYDIVGLDFD